MVLTFIGLFVAVYATHLSFLKAVTATTLERGAIWVIVCLICIVAVLLFIATLLVVV